MTSVGPDAAKRHFLPGHEKKHGTPPIAMLCRAVSTSSKNSVFASKSSLVVKRLQPT
jgi:hypothetical protein